MGLGTPAARDSPCHGKPQQAEQPTSRFLLVSPPRAQGIRQRSWGHGQSFLSQGSAAFKPAACVSAQQQVRNTEASANKNRPEGTNFCRKCRKTEMYVAQFMNFGGEGEQYTARRRNWRGLAVRADCGNMQSSIRRRIRGRRRLYNMEASFEHSTRAARGSASPGKMEVLRGLEVSKASLAAPWREAR